MWQHDDEHKGKLFLNMVHGLPEVYAACKFLGLTLEIVEVPQ
jgi:hypothetical protein